MLGTNVVILMGHVGADPETNTTKSGQKVSNFRLATNRRVKDKETVTEWHSIEVWGNVAEIVEKYVRKGTSLSIVGEIRYGSYEKDGQTHKTVKIVANQINLISSNKEEGAKQPPVVNSAKESVDAFVGSKSQTNSTPTPAPVAEPTVQTNWSEDDIDDLPF